MSILKIKDSQGNWVGVPTVKGNTGNGISSAILNDDYTLTLTFTDGTTYKTPSIRGEKGEKGEPATDMEIHICSASEYDAETRVPTIANPDDKTFYLVPTEDGTSPDLFTEWVYVNGAWEMFGSASVDLSGYLTDVQVNGTSVVTDGIAEVSIEDNGMVVTATLIYSTMYRVDKTYAEITQAVTDGKNVVLVSDDKAYPYAGMMYFQGVQVITFGSFFAYEGRLISDGFIVTMDGDDTLAQKIQSESTIPTVNVDDVQINGTSIVDENGVANVPIASSGKLGVVKIDGNYGILCNNNNGGYLYINPSSESNIKRGTMAYQAIVPLRQHVSTFYGLAKAAGDTTQSQSSNAVGNYTDNAKDSIQNMLGITPLIASHESDPFESAHVVGELFIIGGKLYRAKTALTAGEYVNEGTNVEVVSVGGVLDDTYVKNTDYAVDRGEGGIVKVNRSLGISVALGTLGLAEVSSTTVKGGSSQYYAISPKYQHESTFYGLAKASGDTTQSQSSNPVGTYTDDAKVSIKNMLGVQDNMVVSITKEEDSETQNTSWQSSKTFIEIHNALTKGINVIVNDNDFLLPYVGQLYQNNIYWLAFGVSTVFNNTNVLFGYLIGDNNGQTIVTQINQNTPIPQIDDSTTSGGSVWSSGKIKDELDYKVNDVRINDNSIVVDGVAEIPIASAEKIGAVKIYSANGIYIDNNHDLAINRATDSQAKNGGASYRPIVPINQHISTFYGLAKVAGHDEKDSTLPVGTYTPEAKSAIKQMLSIADNYDSFIVDVEGTDPTITGQPSYRYNCGEVLSLTVTPPETGTIDFRFTSGSSPTVLTLPSTVKMPEWWVEVEANTIYEMCITDGVYCGVMSWAM